MNKLFKDSEFVIYSIIFLIVIFVGIALLIKLVIQFVILKDISNIIDWLSSYGGTVRGNGYYTIGFGILFIAIVFIAFIIYLIKELRSKIKHN